jgi:hypothetical protein
MRRTLIWVIVAGVLIAGCGGGSDSSNGGSSGGSGSSSKQSAGDEQYIDPFQNDACFSAREIKQKIRRIDSEARNPERKKKAIQAVRSRAC